MVCLAQPPSIDFVFYGRRRHLLMTDLLDEKQGLLAWGRASSAGIDVLHGRSSPLYLIGSDLAKAAFGRKEVCREA